MVATESPGVLPTRALLMPPGGRWEAMDAQMPRELGSAFPLIFDGPLAGRSGRLLRDHYAVELDDGTVVEVASEELRACVARALGRLTAAAAPDPTLVRTLGS